MPGCSDALGLGGAERVCLLLVDGLGATLLDQHAGVAPYLASAPRRTLSVGCPSTTATSLASLGTGLPPGQHGLLGYEVVGPGGSAVLNHLRWDATVDPAVYQPLPTLFERAVDAGVAVTSVASRHFERSGLTRAALRGGAYTCAETLPELVAGAVAALTSPGPARRLAYVYHPGLDAAGHQYGCTSAAWLAELAAVDGFVASLVEALPAGVILAVTGDHGMVDVAGDRRVDVAADAQMRAGVRLLTGEPRARYLHVEPGAAGDVLATWSERLGPATAVVEREEAVAAGWFGPMDARFADRLGEVLAVATAPDAYAVMDSRSMSQTALALVGMHGGRSAEEMLVPLINMTT